MTKRTSYSDLRKRIKSLEKENTELKEANGILRGIINGLAIKSHEKQSEEPKKPWWRVW